MPGASLLIDLGNELGCLGPVVAGISTIAHVFRLLLAEPFIAVILTALGFWGFLHRDVG